jgi:hypothetical protein
MRDALRNEVVLDRSGSLGMNILANEDRHGNYISNIRAQKNRVISGIVSGEDIILRPIFGHYQNV